MKRYGNLFEQVCNFQSLCDAAHEAAKGKKAKKQTAAFLLDLEPEVLQLEAELQDRSYHPGSYYTFIVKEPKERMICATGFRDRVVHHAICKVLEPIFERSYVFDSYACRKGKGTHTAIKRAQNYMGHFQYYLKLDIRKYFDSVDHEILKALLRRKIKDQDLLWLLDTIIDHPVPWTNPGKGIPIGNLTSQHFANFYLDQADHFIKDDLGVKGYVRYMDDLLLFDNDKKSLWQIYGQVEQFLNERLELTVKSGSVVLSPTFEGLSFLGLRVYPRLIRLSRKGWRRFRRNVIQKEKLFRRGIISGDELSRSISSVVGHIGQANTRNLRASFFENIAEPDV